MGRECHGERLLNEPPASVALFAVCLRECSYGTFDALRRQIVQKSQIFVATLNSL